MNDRSFVRRLAAIAAIALALFAGLRLRETARLERGPHLAWKAWDAGLADAHRTGKRIVVEFGATWCRPCRELERKTLSRPSVVRALRAFVTVHVDVDAEPDRAKRWFVGALPTLAVMTADEELVALLPGYVTPRQMLAWLERARTSEPRRMPDFMGAKTKKGAGRDGRPRAHP